ncbi:hypothetical protein N7519_010654 [Penicillium mononematosum]|uniref:uncharacterized protein n=1 Tax=Penicillium mononematosum TaxID=268346 RepID=UPI002548227F|nr:uncharacterized protein N7519_010654 [Penicillium mononematosum]KAJ6180193.1 hypothetical protein N7519_010654 [Penicillium mononematosum]
MKLRYNEPSSIPIQEAYEAAGWHMQNTPREEVCFDRHFLLMTFIQFDRSYNDYLQGRAGVGNNPFIVMKPFGPFMIDLIPEMAV